MLFGASEGRGFSPAAPTPQPEIVENVGARFAAGLKRLCENPYDSAPMVLLRHNGS